MAGPGGMTPIDARLILSDEALDRALELLLLAEAALWITADDGLDREAQKLGRGHFRAAFLIKRKPGIGVQELARLTGLSKQGASKVLSELTAAGLVEKAPSEEDARRRPARLTAAGEAFEMRMASRLRGAVAKAYRSGGMEHAPSAHLFLSALARVVMRDSDLR